MKFLLLILIPGWLFSQPNITGVSFTTGDTIQHNITMTITGTGFGIKSPAAPVMWDNCENRTINIVNEWQNAGWTEAHPYPSIPDTWEIQYRDSAYRNAGAPHLHSTKIMGGGHYEGDLGCTTKDARDVLVTKYWGGDSRVCFAMWYKRLDPLWQDRQVGWDYNYKDWVIQRGPTAWWLSEYVYCGAVGNYGPAADSTAQHRMQMIALDTLGNSYGNKNYGTYPMKICDNGSYLTQYRDDFASVLKNHDDSTAYGEKFNEATGWMKQEIMFASNSVGLIYEKGYPMPEYTERDRGAYTFYQDNIPFFGIGPAAGPIRFDQYQSLSLGGYHRIDITCENGIATMRDDDWQWFDDMYIDTVLSRVLLTDKASYNSSKLAEIQIPSAWSGTSVTVTTNLGILDSPRAALDTVYVWVFDRDNLRNSTGYPVVIGEAVAPPSGQATVDFIKIE